MRKLFYLLSIILVSGLIILGCSGLVVSQVEKEEEPSFAKAKPIKLPNVACYNLNIVGKKADWSSGGNYNNWDRHIMFVPEDTTGLTFVVGRATFADTGYYVTQCYATNNGNVTWNGSVDMVVKDFEGHYLYSSLEAFWPEIKLKPGERDYLIAKIPLNESIRNAPQGILVIVWSWGRQEATKRVRIK